MRPVSCIAVTGSKLRIDLREPLLDRRTTRCSAARSVPGSPRSALKRALCGYLASMLPLFAVFVSEVPNRVSTRLKRLSPFGAFVAFPRNAQGLWSYKGSGKTSGSETKSVCLQQDIKVSDCPTHSRVHADMMCQGSLAALAHPPRQRRYGPATEAPMRRCTACASWEASFRSTGASARSFGSGSPRLGRLSICGNPSGFNDVPGAPSCGCCAWPCGRCCPGSVTADLGHSWKPSPCGPHSPKCRGKPFACGVWATRHGQRPKPLVGPGSAIAWGVVPLPRPGAGGGHSVDA